MTYRVPEQSGGARGQTLIETILACVLMVVIFGAGLSLSVESRDAWSHIYQDTGALQAARDALRHLATELATSSPDHVTITPGGSYDTLDFQVPVSLSNGQVTWGADGTADHFIRVSVVNGSLLRQVMYSAVTPVVRTRLLVKSVDPLHGGEKGFAVTRDGILCTIRLRVRAQQDGQIWRKQVNTGVLLRNQASG